MKNTQYREVPKNKINMEKLNDREMFQITHKKELHISCISGSKLDSDAIFVECGEINCKLCRYYKSESDNVCIQNCERLGLLGYYR